VKKMRGNDDFQRPKNGFGRYGRGRGGRRRRGAGRPRAIPLVTDAAPVEGVKVVLELTKGEFEVLRLVDQNDLTQEQAAAVMGVSRGTVWRYISCARKKVIKALLEGSEIFIRIIED